MIDDDAGWGLVVGFCNQGRGVLVFISMAFS